jgi:hypothetical protein
MTAEAQEQRRLLRVYSEEITQLREKLAESGAAAERLNNQLVSALRELADRDPHACIRLVRSFSNRAALDGAVASESFDSIKGDNS